MQKFEVFKGRETVELSLPDAWNVYEVPMPGGKPLEDPVAELERQLADPLFSPPIDLMVTPAANVVICVTDISRPCPDHLLLPPILRQFEKANVHHENITILIGLGEHRPMTTDEMKEKYGAEVFEKYKIINHDARDQEHLADLLSLKGDMPRVVNSILEEADFIMSVGLVDLHQYAGFSGGAKTIAVGCAGEQTIKHTHSADFLEASGAVPGRVHGNHFQEALWDIVRPLPFEFAVNVILNDRGEILDLKAGEPREVHSRLIDEGKHLFITEVNEKFDMAILGVPYPKDVNLYQATRAATYQALSGASAFKEGAPLILVAECPEKFGQGVGENRFLAKMQSGDPASVLAELTGKKSLPGEQRAFMVVKTMVHNPVHVWGSAISDRELEAAGFVGGPLVPPGTEDKPLNVLIMKDGQKKVVHYKG